MTGCGGKKRSSSEADKTGHEAELVDAKRLKFQISPGAAPSWVGDAVLQRCIGHYRSISLTRILENYGIDVVNQYTVSEACGNKLATTMLLAGAHVPTPRTFFALTADAVADIAESVGFPLVLKPLVGSWGRMVSIAKDMETLTSLVELRGELPNPIDHMYYVQEYVRRPPRDIRAIVTGDEIVATVFRNSSEGEWRTNVARGASTESFRPEPELQEMLLRAAHAVGGGVLGVDAMESPSGYQVHEVNGTVEFKGAQSAVKTNIARKIVQYVVSRDRR